MDRGSFPAVTDCLQGIPFSLRAILKLQNLGFQFSHLNLTKKCFQGGFSESEDGSQPRLFTESFHFFLDRFFRFLRCRPEPQVRQIPLDGKEFSGCMAKYSEKGSRVSPEGKVAFLLRFGHQGFRDFAKSRSTSENSGPHSAGSIWAASGISTFWTLGILALSSSITSLS